MAAPIGKIEASVGTSTIAGAMATHRSMLVVSAHFRGLNEVWEDFGDTVTMLLRQRILERMRAVAICAEWSTHNGLIAAIDSTANNAPVALAALAKEMSGFYTVDGQVLHARPSLGAACFPQHGRRIDILVRRAELARRRASVFAQPHSVFAVRFEEEEKEKRALESALRAALFTGEFELVYQPQYALASQSISGFEALLRWRRDGLLLAPASFVPTLEEMGLIARVGEWAIRKGCSDAACWPPDVSVAINVSPIQLSSARLVPSVVSALGESGLPPHRLELEVTESCLIGDAVAALATLQQLRTLGVRISLDDFGTGYSSLSYLRRFPFDKLKIDRSFVKEATDGDAILSAIVQIARSLSMTTLAEGVETECELAVVRTAGCAAIQGFLLSAPIGLADVDDFLSGMPRLPGIATP